MNRLRQLRIENNMRQSDVAKFLGRTESAVGQYEREKRDPTSETWCSLANFFGVSLDYILGNSEIRTPISEFSNSAYYKEMEGLTEDEIVDALKTYRKVKYNNINI